MSARDLTLADVQRLALEAGESVVTLQMDEEAFRAFYDRTSRPLWSYLARLTRDRPLADDLVQETYYRFLRAGTRHESDAHRRYALFHIATNLARDEHRRRLFRRTTTTDAPSGQAPAGRPEVRLDLERAMARLRPRDRALVWLAYAEGASHREIAAALGVGLASVKTLLYRARHRLAGLLAAERPDREGRS